MAGSDGSREKWDARYREAHSTAGVAGVLSANLSLLPERGRALELACGMGANALLLAQRGLEVEAWDISALALQKLSDEAELLGLQLHTECRDIIAQPPPHNSFDLIIVSRFLHRALCPAIAAALKPGGLLLYQTYTVNRKEGEGPSCPDFLLTEGELPQLFAGLQLLSYEEAAEARLVAIKTP